MTVSQIDGAVRSLPTGTVADQVFSPDGQTLYTSRNGTITAYNVTSGAISGSWALGTTLGGIDVSADGKYLVATEVKAGPSSGGANFGSITDYYVYRLDLTTGVETTFTNHAANYDSNFFDAAFLPDGRVLLTQNFAGSGFEPLTTLDFTTGTFTRGTGSDAQNGTLTASPDKVHIAYLPSNISDAPVRIYTAGSGITASHGGYADNVSGFNRGVQAISPAGDLVVQGLGLNVYDGQLHFQRSLSTLYPQFTASNVAGLIFSPAGDRLYLLDVNAREVFALDTKTWAVLGGYPVGAATSTSAYGTSYGDALTISADGHTLAVVGTVSVQLLDLTKLVNDAGTPGDDTLVGDGSNNYLYGFAGNDSIDGGAGADVMYGGTGDDSYYVDNQSDQVIENAGQGYDTIYSSVSYYLPDNVERLVLTGTSAINAGANAAAATLIGNDAANILTGGFGDDILIGNGGNDTLNGGPGNDTMSGGTGDDTYYVDSPADKVIEAAGEGNDVVYANISYVLPDNVERLILTGNDSLSGTGNALDNRITGNSGDNILAGLGGNDVIDGGAGIDTAVIASTAAQATIVLGTTGVVTVSSPDGIDTLTSIEKIRLTDGTVTTADIATIQTQYQAWGGRAATTGELVYWSGRVDGGVTATGIRTAILSDPLGINHNHMVVGKLYFDYGARAATAGELQVWDGLIANGAGFDTVRSALLGDQLGATAAQVVRLYNDYAGRTPADGEVGFWVGQVKAGTTIGQIRQAILDDGAGQAHTDATVTGLYQTFGGRAPTPGELTTWEGLVRGGYTFAQVRSTILDDQLGRTYTGGLISATYHAEFGRDATTGEVATWLGLFKTGVSMDTFLDTLIADRGSDATGTARLAGTPASDSFVAGHGHETTVTSFDIKNDVLKLAFTDVGSNPLDAAHARQVFAFDGTPDILFTLNDGHHVLVAHTALADLSAANLLVI